MEKNKLWSKYEKAVQYNSSFRPNKDYYELIKVCYAFYNGDQWLGLDNDNTLPHPTFNIIKRIIEFFIASLISSDIGVSIEPLENIAADDSSEYTDSNLLNAEIKNIFEKTGFKVKVKEVLLDGAITGDMCFHTVFNPQKKAFRGQDILGEIEIEIIDSTNVFLGNPNITDIEKQPWIIVIGRDTVKALSEEAKYYKSKDEIKEDGDTEYQATDFADTEIEGDGEGKALYIYYYHKEKNKETGEEIVHCTKCTREAIIFNDRPLDTNRYPIAFANWYKQKNTFHGRGVVEGICSNQIAINKLFAMAIYHQMMTAFPTAVYDADLIKSWNNQIGTAFGLKGLARSGKSFRDVAGYLEPANMSDWIIKMIDLCFQYTKECLGVSDASMGQVNPTNTSAIIAVQKSTAVPLANIKDNLYHLVEQEVLILIDLMANKYGLRPVVIENTDGIRRLVNFDFSSLKNMDLKTNIDVGEASYWNEVMQSQSLDNLLANERINFLQYLERVPNSAIPKKAELIADIKQEAQEQQAQPGMPAQDNSAMYEQMAQYVDSLPLEQQQQIRSMDPQQMENYVMNLMNQ